QRFSDDAASDGREEISPDSTTAQPSPSATVTKVPTPSATVEEVRGPSSNPAIVVKPTPRIITRPRDRREESPAPPKRAQTDNRLLADQHYEQARLLYHQRQFKAAIGECDEALRLNPRHGNARKLKGEINRLLKILNSR